MNRQQRTHEKHKAEAKAVGLTLLVLEKKRTIAYTNLENVSISRKFNSTAFVEMSLHADSTSLTN